jgi:hypothetical protein
MNVFIVMLLLGGIGILPPDESINKSRIFEKEHVV